MKTATGFVFAFSMLLGSATALAVGYKVDAKAPKGWDAGVEFVAVVVTECHESLNCEDLREQIAGRLFEQAKKLPFKVIPDREVRPLVGWDATEPETLRTTVFEKTKADAILEVQAPFAAAAKFRNSGAEVRVRIRIVTKNGETRMSGDCSAQAFNVLSSPENISRHCALRILGKALGKNLD